MSLFLRDTASDPYFAGETMETQMRTTTMTARNIHATATRQLRQSSPHHPVFTGCTFGSIQNLVIHVLRK